MGLLVLVDSGFELVLTSGCGVLVFVWCRLFLVFRVCFWKVCLVRFAGVVSRGLVGLV